MTIGTKSELMAAIRGLSAARDLPPEVVLDALRAALVSAYHKIPEAEETHVTVDIDEGTGAARVFAHYTVVEEEFLEDPHGEIAIEQAKEIDSEAEVGDTITHEVTPSDFGRIAAQTAKQVILQRIREAEREQTYSTYADREGEIVYGTIQTANRDNVTVALERVEALLPKSQQIPGEHYSPNERLRVYVTEVKRSPKGPQVIVSRTHRDMLKRLMELEIPEIFQGSVEIKAIAREAGSRSKVAVWAHQEGVDPVGACVGMRGVRIQALVRELGGEKIDIVEWDPDPRVFIAHALSPAKVMHVWLEEQAERRTANVIVPDDQLSLAIGREGQNARLAAKLTGWRIDIRAESEAEDVLERLQADKARRQAERAAAAGEVVEAVAEEEVEVALEEVEEIAAVDEAEVVAPAAEPAVEEEAIAAEAPAEVATAEPAAEEAVEEAETEALPPAAEAAEVEPPVVTEAPPAEAPPAEEAPAEEAPPAERQLKKKKKRPQKQEPADLFEDDDEYITDEKTGKRRKRRLVRDPKTGELVAERRRKRSRRRPDWEEDIGRWTEDELHEVLQFTEEDFLNREDEDEFGLEDEEDGDDTEPENDADADEPDGDVDVEDEEDADAEGEDEVALEVEDEDEDER